MLPINALPACEPVILPIIADKKSPGKHTEALQGRKEGRREIVYAQKQHRYTADFESKNRHCLQFIIIMNK